MDDACHRRPNNKYKDVKQKLYILVFLFGWMLFPKITYAQVDFNSKPDDDLGHVNDKFQELFYEALKQKAIANYDRSVDALLKCIDINDKVAVLYFELGKNYNILKNFGAAERAFKTAVKIKPDNPWYLQALYVFYKEQNEFDKAIKILRQLIRYRPDYKEDLAELYVQIKKYKQALKILDELDSEYGISKSRDVLRNGIYKVTGRKKDQIQNLKSRVDNNPEKESNYIALIFRYSENNDKEKAFETAKKLLSINPESQIVHLALYKFYLDDNNTEKAIESMKIVLKSTQIKPEAKLKVLSDFISFVHANPQYEDDLLEVTALVGDSNNSKTLIELAQYYLKRNQKEKALKYYEEALVLESNNFRILRNVLLLYMELEQYDLALNKSTKALEKYPSQPIFYLINAVTLNRLNKPQKAIEILESGLDFIIDDTKMEADFYNQLSKAHYLLNNTDKAKTFSDKAKQLQSSN